MASRHYAHLTWVHDGAWLNLTPASKVDDTRDGQVPAMRVRRALTRSD